MLYENHRKCVKIDRGDLDMEKYGLHDRQRRLLYLLNCEHGMITGKDLALKLGISERTVRNDITQINEKMAEHQLEILAVRGKGYALKVGSRKVFHELFSSNNGMLTREDRIKFLIMKLARTSEWCDLLELEDDLFVSHTTLENDIREIRNRISEHEPYLTVLREGNRIRLDDDEVKRRNIMVRLYSENWDYDSRDGIILEDQLMSPETLDMLRRTWKDILRRNNILVDDFGMIYILIASAVARTRLIEGHTLPSAIDGQTFHLHQARRIFEAVDMFWECMEREWKVSADVSEHRWMENILGQLVILNFTDENKEAMAGKTDRCCGNFADLLMGEIRDKYHIPLDLAGDFRNDFILHIQALMNSMVSVQTQSKYIIDELRMRYPFIGDLCHYLCRRLKDLCGVRMSEDDEDYLLPFLCDAWQSVARKETKGRIRAVLVSHFNYGLSHYLINEIRIRYGNRMTIEGPFPIYDRQKIDSVEPSLILTTARMNAFREYPIPVLTISPLLERTACENIEKCVDTLVNRYMYPDPPKGTHYFRHSGLELFVERRMELSQILGLMEENLRGNYLVNQLLTICWEKCYYILLSTECLFIYMIGSHGQSTVMTSVVCKYVTTWQQNRNIRKIIFMIVSEDEIQYLGSFYRLMQEEASENFTDR